MEEQEGKVDDRAPAEALFGSSWLSGWLGLTERENKKIQHSAAAFLTGTAKIWVQPWDPSEHRHGFKEQQSWARFSTAMGIRGKCGYN
ncbi:hypothetical protein EYR41_010466 [Orbilia oligospora]|uniref:Uncharacterized protein n=1 Tax=Orbilia oligospora TaxID=2813651 RepID=A0A8H2DSY8_ORBOL|nr:hypothetical protein EYR41_010466 [Orbilia oligospora]